MALSICSIPPSIVNQWLFLSWQADHYHELCHPPTLTMSWTSLPLLLYKSRGHQPLLALSSRSPQEVSNFNFSCFLSLILSPTLTMTSPSFYMNTLTLPLLMNHFWRCFNLSHVILSIGASSSINTSLHPLCRRHQVVTSTSHSMWIQPTLSTSLSLIAKSLLSSHSLPSCSCSTLWSSLSYPSSPVSHHNLTLHPCPLHLHPHNMKLSSSSCLTSPPCDFLKALSGPSIPSWPNPLVRPFLSQSLSLLSIAILLSLLLSLSLDFIPSCCLVNCLSFRMLVFSLSDY